MKLERNVLLSNLTTIKLGGQAQYFVSAENTEAVKEALAYAKDNNLKVHILGGGSNIIFPDEPSPALVIKVDIKGVEYKDEGETTLATVGAGEDWDAFVRETVSKGLAGLECLSGIPGSAGGTPIQNVGAYGQEVSETIAEVRALEITSGKEVVFSNDECEFGYRLSRFRGRDKGKYIITHVAYRLQKNGQPKIAYPELAAAVTDKTSLAAARAAVLGLRREKSMLLDPSDPDSASCGSFFVNPTVTPEELARIEERKGGAVPNWPAGDESGRVKVSAAWLIEQAGWQKGHRHDGVGISSHHALALINRGGGTTKDLLELAERIEKSVFEKFGVKLEREPEIIK